MTGVSHPSSSKRSAHFRVRTAADPQALLRVLGLLAQRDLVPSALRVSRHAQELIVAIVQPGLSDEEARIISEKLRSLVIVGGVELEMCLERRAA